jgi:uncharacterized protein
MKLLIAIVLSIFVSSSAFASDLNRQSPDWRSRVVELVNKRFTHPAWGSSHAHRVYALARTLASRDATVVDDDIMFAAAMLHDIAMFEPWRKPRTDHGDRGALVVRQVLTEAGFPRAKIASVSSAIMTHMYDRDPVTSEAIYVHDADALEWLGSVGVARAVALVNDKGQRPTLQDAISNLRESVRDVPARVISSSGKALIQERVSFVERFIADLEHDTSVPGGR